MIDHYDWVGGREAMIRFGPATGPVVVAVLPLFEEANRTRTFVVGLLRRLADRGIAGLLPDVPGQGESLVPLANCTLPRMAEAIEALAGQQRDSGRTPYALGIRSGALDIATDDLGDDPEGHADIAAEHLQHGLAVFATLLVS